jgi:hypothetical protein
MKTQLLNLKTFKTQVSIKYLTQKKKKKRKKRKKKKKKLAYPTPSCPRTRGKTGWRRRSNKIWKRSVAYRHAQNAARKLERYTNNWKAFGA